MNSEGIHYAGNELEAMARAQRYYGWIVSQWRSHLSGAVLEFGAGTGNFSLHLARARVRRLILVEPTTALFEQLRRRFVGHTDVELRNGRLQDVEGWLASSLDVVLSVNVLEHIADDVDTLRAAHRLLRPGGTLLLFVPAFPSLYGSLDRAFGHVRRYTKRTLTSALSDARFAIVRLRYVNLVGTLPWILAGRVFRRTSLDPRAVALADRTIVPLTLALERVIDPPFGQSLLAVARKSDV